MARMQAPFSTLTTFTFKVRTQRGERRLFMSDRTCASIEIGGRLPRSHTETLITAIKQAGVSLDWGDAHFEPHTVEQLTQSLKEDRLWLCDDQANYGEFPALESTCRRLKLAYTRCSDGGVVYDAGRVDWRPGMTKPLARRCSTESNGCILVPQEAVEKALVALRNGDNAETRRRLETVCVTLPPLPPFEVV